MIFIYLFQAVLPAETNNTEKMAAKSYTEDLPVQEPARKKERLRKAEQKEDSEEDGEEGEDEPPRKKKSAPQQDMFAE